MSSQIIVTRLFVQQVVHEKESFYVPWLRYTALLKMIGWYLIKGDTFRSVPFVEMRTNISYDCLRTSEAALKYMGNVSGRSPTKPRQNGA